MTSEGKLTASTDVALAALYQLLIVRKQLFRSMSWEVFSFSTRKQNYGGRQFSRVSSVGDLASRRRSHLQFRSWVAARIDRDPRSLYMERMKGYLVAPLVPSPDSRVVQGDATSFFFQID